MKEILIFDNYAPDNNLNIDIFFVNNNLNPICTYIGLKYRIYQFEDKEYDIFIQICDSISEEEWNYNGWRYSEGSNIEDDFNIAITKTYINGEDINIYYSISKMEDYVEGWYEDYCMEAEEDIERIQEDLSEEFLTKKYDNIFDYCCEMFGCSMETNIYAICTSLAKLNDITVSELFQKYAGGI